MSARLPILHNSLLSGLDFQFALLKPEIGVDNARGRLKPCPCPEPPAKRIVSAQRNPIRGRRGKRQHACGDDFDASLFSFSALADEPQMPRKNWRGWYCQIQHIAKTLQDERRSMPGLRYCHRSATRSGRGQGPFLGVCQRSL